MTIGELWDKIKALFEPLVERRIKDVESWDGAASNYADTDAYCAACLVDVNSAAGRDTKVQSHCMLPVRGPGDSADTYVRQAIYAAVAGRGIGRVERPDDVPTEAWDAAVKAAANKIISAYGEMDETAPASIYELAGKEAPKGAERAVSMPEVYMGTAKALEESDAYLVDVFTDDGGQMYAIANQDGALFRVPLTIADGSVEIGELEPVQMEFAPRAERGLTVTRQADGRYRWVAVACTAILNRVGEVDSRALFENFVKRIAAGEPMPLVDFWHMNGSEFGVADYVDWDGYALIASGLFDDAEVGRAAAEGIARDPTYWGTSIKYRPKAGERVEVANGVRIPVYTDGVLLRVSILPESKAASLYTTITGGVQMKDEIRAALLKLLGRDELVDQVAHTVDGVNERAAEPGVIARDAEPAPEAAPVAPAAPASEAEGIAALMKRITDLEEALALLTNAVQGMGAASEDGARSTDHRLSLLERADEERKRAWLSDLPARARIQQPVFRPREQAPATDEPMPTASQRAQEILKRKFAS